MRKLSALVAASVVALALTAGASANSPAIHETENVVGDVIPCDNGVTLTVISGYLKITFHEGASASGNMNVTGTLVPVGVVFSGSDGNTYYGHGASWFGGAFNAQTGGLTFTDTEHFTFTGPGGIVGVVRTTMHVSPNGHEVSVDMSTCTLPEED